MTSQPRALTSLLHRLTDEIAPDLAEGFIATTPRGVAPSLARFVEGSPFTLAVVASQREADDLADDVAGWLGDDSLVAQWPAWDIAPFERVSPDIAVMGRRTELRARLAIPHARPKLVVATVRSLLQALPPTGEARHLAVGGELDRDELIGWLVANGYRREPQVEHRGEVAARGDIVDVWLSHLEEPVRIELFGDEIERIATFDISNQRSLQRLSDVAVLAAREWRLTDEQRAAAAHAATTHPFARETFEQLAEGEYFDGMEGWLAWFAQDRTTLLDIIPDDARLVLVDESILQQRAAELLNEENELATTVAETWELTEATPLLHFDWSETLGATSVALRVHGHVVSGATARWNVTDPPVVQGSPERLALHLRSRTPDVAVVITSSETSRDRLAGLAAEQELFVDTSGTMLDEADVTFLTDHLPRGLDSGSIIVWSEGDFTGRRVQRRQPRARTRHVDGFFDDLAIGSFVVHRNIGIAKYAGSTTRTIGETTRDYLILEFKGNDRLFLPTDQIDLLTPYSGAANPTLSRMGGAEWTRTRNKARTAAKLVADELVELYRLRAGAKGFQFSPDTQWQVEMENLFPFTETPDQLKAIEDVKADMESDRPMDRLVCADVGFGKTEIAIRAVFKAVQDGKQAAVLVPTTLLASQHFTNMVERFASFPVKVALLSRFVTEQEVRQTLDGLKDGSIDVVVGTHKLLSDSIKFHDLGLLVVDEEQRFGVSHKDAIKRMSVGVDVLTLTASPIPRTLEMALTGIRDLSMVTTPPMDRQPILTHVGEFEEAAIVEAIRRELLREGQVFYVHNRVADIEEVAKKISLLVPEARVVVAHAQMEEGQLEQIVQDFWEQQANVLVCTTIVESGIDMPTVNTLIVDRADRLGLGQLHQLRGRVGRAGSRAYAYLFHPRDMVLSETAYERLRCIGDNTALGSGFKIAMRDLEIRGAGNLLGHEQSGMVADVGYDLYVQLVAEAVTEAKGQRVLPPSAVVLPRLGIAHLPNDYIESEDQRLEAYRRMTAASSDEELADVAAEWRDRFGPLPAPAEGLMKVMSLRVECLRHGISEISLQAQGERTLVRFNVLTLPDHVRERVLHRYGNRAIDPTTNELSCLVERTFTTVEPLTELVREIWMDAPSVA